MIDPLDHRVILASAGTGKTFALTNRLIALLARGDPPQTLLASTFTRKAAGEILQRVIARLAHAADDPDSCAQLTSMTDPALTPARAGQLLASVLESIHRLSIQTIDAFFLRLARVEAFELGLAGSWGLADEDTDQAMRDKALSRALDEGDHAELIALIEMVQQLNPGRSVRGAINTALDRSYRVYLQGAHDLDTWLRIPHADEPMSTTALADALDTIAKLDLPVNANGSPNKPWANAIATTQHLAELGCWEELLTKGLPAKILQGETTFSKHEITQPIERAITPIIDHARAVLLGRVRARNAATHDLLARFDHAYQRIKRRSGQFRFDDIPRLLAGADALGDLEHLYYRLDARIGHVLLDEFQDTSLEQFALIRPILDELLASDERTVLCVGDAKQSLYSWRNAEPKLLASLDQHWPQLHRSTLAVSYRSSPAVLDAVNTVFAQIEACPALAGTGADELWRGRYEIHEPAPANRAMPGLVRLTVAPAADDDDDTPTLTAAAARVADILDQTPAASVGVLMRRNEHIPALIHLLRQRGIEASAEGGCELTDSLAVASALSLIHLAAHPGDTMALYQVASSPIGSALGLDDPLDHDTGRRVGSRIRSQLARRGYTAVLRNLLTRCASVMSRRDRSRFDQLIDLAQDYDRAAHRSPSGFVQLVLHASVESPASRGVRVMTIHGAKGLEFDAVVLAELDQPLGGNNNSPPALADRADPLGAITAASCCPVKAIRQLDPDLTRLYHDQRAGQIAEDLCGLYVAMTRAIRQLEMIIAPSDKPPAATPAGILRWALAPDASAQPEAELYRSALGQLTASPPQAETTPAPEPVELTILPPERIATGRLARQGPSALAGGERVHAAQLLRPVTSRGAARGELIHAWFEQVGWIEDPLPDDETLIQTGAALGWTRNDAAAQIPAFRRALDAEPIARALSRAQAASLGEPSLVRERPFAVRIDDPLGPGQVVSSGRFDRLVTASRDGRIVWARVLDFKTDTIDESHPPESLVATYQPQLEAYRRAAAVLTGRSPAQVEAALVLTSPGLVVEVPPMQPGTPQGAADG